MGAPDRSNRGGATVTLGGGIDPDATVTIDGPNGLGAGVGPSPRPDELQIGAVIGRYRITGLLGRGGMGVVYQAADPELARLVAIKVLPADSSANADTDATAQRQRRLLREAKALAQVSHPNVLTVFDAGEVAAGIFIAMELVKGQTMRQWVQAAPRTARAILQAYIAAGQGLAAAHAVGLVHRDVKPDNILIGDDGRVRVADFGLARGDDEPTLDSSEAAVAVGTPAQVDGAERDVRQHSPAPSSGGPSSGALAARGIGVLTQPGGRVGTPGYMPPEQLLGKAIDSRVDQFAFCISLWESLAGGKRETPARIPRVSAHLMRTLRRGTAPSKADRFESMQRLLHELGRELTRRRRWLIGAGAAALVVGGVTAGLVLRDNDAPSCTLSAIETADLWSPDQRLQARAVLTQAGLPPATVEQIDLAFGNYRAQWIDARTATCKATRIDHVQPESMMALRVSCLERLRSEAVAAANLFRTAERSTSEHAAALVSGLTPIESCADDVALQRRLPPPRDAQLRGRVNELRTKIDNVAVMFDAGQFREARQALTPLLDQATALGYRPLIAETLFALGRYQDTLGEPALATLEHALWEAEAAGHTELTAAVLTRMITVVGNQGDTERQAVLTKRVEAVLLSLGDPPFLRGELDNSLATLDLANGRFAEALAGFGKAKAAWRLALPARHVSFGGLENNLCIALNQLQRFDEAAEHCRAAVALWRDLLGPRHGDLAKPLGNLGLALAMQGHIDEALDAQRTALELAEASLGATSPMLTGAIAKLANTELAANQPEISLALYQRARALSESQPGGPGVEARDLAEVDNQIGSIQLRLGQPDAALQSFQTAHAAFAKTVGPESIQVAATLVNIAQVQASKRQHVQAIATLEQARVLVGKLVGPEQLDYRKMLVMLGQQHLAAGHAVVARGFFEQTLQGTGSDLDTEVQGLAKFGLAQSLWRTGADRSKASALALDAEQLLQRAGVPDVAEVSAWRAMHRHNADER